MPKIDPSDFNDSVDKHLKNLSEQVYKDVVAAGQEVRNGAVKKTPVDTGNLRAGWQARQKRTTRGGEVTVFNEVPYAGFVEYGTRYQAAKPMLRPSVAEVLEKLKQKFRRY